METRSAFRVKLATPCKTTWGQMSGDDKVRFCALCKKNVYNLSTLTRDEAVGLVKAKEGDMCATFFQRPDGTVMTADCSVGVRRARFAMAAAFSLLFLVFIAPVFFMRKTSQSVSSWDTLVDHMRELPGIGTLVNYISPERMVAGGIRAMP